MYLITERAGTSAKQGCHGRVLKLQLFDAYRGRRFRTLFSYFLVHFLKIFDIIFRVVISYIFNLSSEVT